MTCREFNKFVGAFADGELDTVRNLDALDHLKMCEACTYRVDQIHALRRALARQARAVPPPPELHTRVATRIRDMSPGRPSSPLRFMLNTRPAAVAAGIILALLAWRMWPATVEDDPTEATAVPGRQVSVVRATHQLCIAEGGRHHDPELPADPQGAGQILGEKLNMNVLAPDLSPHGFQFVGAGVCELRGSPAAHLLYKAQATGDHLSVFTVDRAADLAPRDSFVVGGRTYHVDPRDPQQRLCVVSWDRDGQTYLWCAKWCPSSLIQVADCACEKERSCRKAPAAGRP